jgi:hypothetical protein
MGGDTGLGPWHVGLFFNLNGPDSEIRLHGSAIHLYANLLNAVEPQDCWVTMMIVGPFFVHRDAEGFQHLWNRYAAGKRDRLWRGIQLGHHYQKAYRLTIWVQKESISNLKAGRSQQLRPFGAKTTTRRLRLKQLLSFRPVPVNRVSLQMIRELKKKRAL